jgi:hypothetical protein
MSAHFNKTREENIPIKFGTAVVKKIVNKRIKWRLPSRSPRALLWPKRGKSVGVHYGWSPCLRIHIHPALILNSSLTNLSQEPAIRYPPGRCRPSPKAILDSSKSLCKPASASQPIRHMEPRILQGRIRLQRRACSSRRTHKMKKWMQTKGFSRAKDRSMILEKLCRLTN